MNSPQPSAANAAQSQQDNPYQHQRDTKHQHNQKSYGPDNITEPIPHHPATPQLSGYSQNPLTANSQPDEIPELEEDWNNEQFADADGQSIKRHNTHIESERIRQEYPQHLLDLTENEYYSDKSSVSQLQYSCSDPDYYRPTSRQ